MQQDPTIRIIRSVRRSISIQIRPDASVIVRAPVFVPMGIINRFIEEKKDWIELQKSKLTVRPKPDAKRYTNGEKLLYLGNPVTLAIGDHQSIQVTHSQLQFPKFLEFRIKEELSVWYISQARQLITERVVYNAKLMNVSYKNISFSDTKSKWGSCTHDNRLQFCWRLIMAPILVINYVVIHELAHTVEKNHSDDFWRKVRAYNPSYKQQIKWLKVHGELLQFSI
jgi:predicted metal-dependent hydrolase